VYIHDVLFIIKYASVYYVCAIITR
jgi:hypothetical protein